MEAISIPSPTAFLNSPTVPSPSVVPAKGSTKKKAVPVASRPPRSVPIQSESKITKPKQSKSRNGCVTCKAKRLKCDETKPACQQCHKRNVDCGGYKKDFKWRAFEEATFTTKPTPRPKKAAVFLRSQALPPGSPSTSDASGSTIGPPFAQASFVPFSQGTPTNQQSHLYTSAGISEHSYSQNGQRFPGELSSYDDLVPQSTPSTSHATTFDRTEMRRSFTQSSFSSGSGQSPRLIDLLLPGSELNAPPDCVNYLPQQSDEPYQPGGYPPLEEENVEMQEEEEVEEEVEEIIRQPHPAEEWVMRLPSPLPSPSSSSSSSAGSLRDSILYNLHSQPKLHPGAQEMLLVGFDRQTCGILSVKDGPTENPWRTLLWPLAQDCPALYHAISSMTAFHISKIRPEMKVQGIEHFNLSLKHLNNGITNNIRTDAALATTLVLAFSESWDVHISSGIEHLRGAKTMIKALTRRQQSPMSFQDQARMRFLWNTWIYMDVIARLTSVEDDDSADLDTSLWSSVGPQFSPTEEVDPLMGCASTLFPLIGRVANLVRKVRKCRTNSIQIISQANDLKQQIEAWEPPVMIETPEDPTSDVKDSLQTAEAYRWATLLYLHQAVPEIPSRPAAELAHEALVRLATVGIGSRTVIVQIYPLLAAGCEAVEQADREWVEQRWLQMSQRMLIGNIERCLDVVREVWYRRDAHEAEVSMEQQRRVDARMRASFLAPYSPVLRRRAIGEEQSNVASFDSDPFSPQRQSFEELSMPETTSFHRRKSSTTDLENLDAEKTVRGRLHWVGVMKDWKWEILLG